jgi:hypothetical protein
LVFLNVDGDREMKVSKLKGILASYHGNTDVVKVFDDMKFTTLASLKKAIDESVNNRNDHNVIDVIMNELDSRRQKNGLSNKRRR